jgi:release factor glutamine methyltransferase
MEQLRALVASAAKRLVRAGIAEEEAALDARLLAQHALGWDAAAYLTRAPEPPPASFTGPYETLIARRARREPVAYIIGRREFWGLTFEVTPAVLIPRPETELIVAAALEAFPGAGRPLRFADVGTGSGCVAVALARERPWARGIATDISREALLVARRNAERHGTIGRLRWVQTSLLDAIDARLDLVAANPPYVPEMDRPRLQPEVRDYEPGAALFAGPDGLAVVRRLVPEAAARLRSGGLLIFEIGAGQEEAAAELIGRTPGLRMRDLRRDLQGLPRTAIAERT